MTPLAAQLVSLAFCGVLLLVVAWWTGTLAGAGRQRRAAERFARRSGLPAAAVPGLVRRVVRRQRWTLAGIAAGLGRGDLDRPSCGSRPATSGWRSGRSRTG